MNQVDLEPSWKARLEDEFSKDYLLELSAFLKHRYDSGAVVYPKEKDLFSAFNKTPYDKVKVVIIGQDPYHGPNQAHGLCFSVQAGIKVPPSLKNIYKELKEDLSIEPPNHGCLNQWADQGVLLINSVLTVEKGQAGAHQKKGWERFTDRVVEVLNESERPIAFILWGSYAQKKAVSVDRNKHLVLESVHPSPLSAHRGFFGSKPFSKVNEFLKTKNREPIDWQLPNISAPVSQNAETSP